VLFKDIANNIIEPVVFVIFVNGVLHIPFYRIISGMWIEVAKDPTACMFTVTG
jgi:hypothetical protein